MNLDDIDISIGVVKHVLKSKLDQNIAVAWLSLIESQTTKEFIPSYHHAKLITDNSFHPCKNISILYGFSRVVVP